MGGKMGAAGRPLGVRAKTPGPESEEDEDETYVVEAAKAALRAMKEKTRANIVLPAARGAKAASSPGAKGGNAPGQALRRGGSRRRERGRGARLRACSCSRRSGTWTVGMRGSLLRYRSRTAYRAHCETFAQRNTGSTSAQSAVIPSPPGLPAAEDRSRFPACATHNSAVLLGSSGAPA